MKNTYKKILKEINISWLMESTSKLMEIERGQTFEDYHRAAQFTAGLVRDAGLENCEIMYFPADGVTSYQDKRMPLAWSATKGRLTIKKAPMEFNEPVIADYERHPFHLIKGSVSTPKDGLFVKIITETQLFGGADTRNALVLLNPLTRPKSQILKAVLELGATGIISDYIKGRYDTPDAIQWVNACTEGGHWHIQAEDGPFIGFNISPRNGDLLRQAVTEGEVTALVECDGVRTAGTLPLVTAFLRGRQDKELWILSHLYEPLSDDNSNGVVASIEIARVLKKLSETGAIAPFEFSLRLVFAMELYGFAAFADKIGSDGRKKVIGAINTDSIHVSGQSKNNIYLAPPGTAFFGNNIMENVIDECKHLLKSPVNRVYEEGMYADDTFLSDPTTGIPTLWALGAESPWWHNSEQKMDMIDPDIFASTSALVGTWVASVLKINHKGIQYLSETALSYAQKHLVEESNRIFESYTSGRFRNDNSVREEIAKRMRYRLKRDSAALADFKKVFDKKNVAVGASEIKLLEAEANNMIAEIGNKIDSAASITETIKSDKWFDYAASIIPERATIGFPFDLLSVPRNKRVPIPNAIIYGPLARILANMDGKKNLQTLIREAEWETDSIIPAHQIKKYITAISYLSDYGYLKTVFEKQYEKDDIVKALGRAGVKKGNLLMVHSSLSQFGIIKGGADTVIDALLECVGKNGTLLFPAFTRPFIYFDGTPCRGRTYRPYDPLNPELIWVGSIPKFAFGRKGVIRSAHVSHSVLGLGPLAEKCLNEHLEADPPTCRRSPFGKLLDYNGKILYLGSGLAPTTFLHLLEDEFNMPYLGNAVCRVKDGDRIRTLLVPKHLPGHRDFYTNDAEKCKFFRRVVDCGLEIKETSLGLGKIQLIDANELYKIGVNTVKKTPDIFLCDNHECFFCSNAKEKILKTIKKGKF